MIMQEPSSGLSKQGPLAILPSPPDCPSALQQIGSMTDEILPALTTCHQGATV